MTTKNRDEPRCTDAGDGDPDRFEWDFVTVLVTIVIIALLLIVTFDFWISRSGVPHA